VHFELFLEYTYKKYYNEGGKNNMGKILVNKTSDVPPGEILKVES